MKPVIIIAIAVVLMFVPSNVFSFNHDSLTESRAALGSDEPQNILTSYYGKLIIGVGFVLSPIIGIIIIVLIIRKFRKKNRESKARTLEDIRKEKTTKGKIWLISASMFWLSFLFALTQDIHGFGFYDHGVPPFSILVIGVVFPFIAFVLTIIGIVKLLRRNNLSKNEKIEQLEDRLGKLETDEEKDSEEK